VVLYGVPPTRAIRPLWIVNLLDLACEVVALNPMDPKDRERIAALNPSCKLPVLVDGDIVLTESIAISLYLAERYGGDRLVPDDVVGRAAVSQWLFFLATEIEQPLWRMALHEAIYPEAERRADEIARAARDCRKELARIEGHLRDRETFVGDAPTVADFVAAYTLDWADEQGLLDAAPNCRRFVERMYRSAKAPPRIAEAFSCLSEGRVAPNLRCNLTGS
jgi:glutathione S-transferase